MRVVIVVVFLLVGQRFGRRVGASVPSRIDIGYRQEQTLLQPLTTTSSYDYWWPYPPGGVYAPTTTTTTSVTPSLTFTAFITDVVSTDISTTSSSASSTSMTTDNTTVSTSSISSSTILASTPRATDSTSNAKPPAHWLLPVLIVVGTLLTLLLVWFCYGLFVTRRGPRIRASSLEPGPRYVPPSPDNDGDHHVCGWESEKVALNGRNMANPSQPSQHDSRYTWSQLKSSQSWLSRAKSSRARATPTKRIDTTTDFSWPDTVPTTTPQKGYFEHKNITPLPVSSRAQPARALSLFSSYCSSPDPLSLLGPDNDENEDLVPYDSLRHKSTRRGILERLKFGTLRQHNQALGPESEQGESGSVHKQSTGSSFRRVRSVHRRADSDALVGHVETPEGLHGCVDYPGKTRSVSRRASDETTTWVGGSGFRIVEEHLDAMWRDIREANAENDARRSQTTDSSDDELTAMSKERSEDATPSQRDNYTPMPVRKVHSKTSTPRKPCTPNGASKHDGLPRVDSSILPHSPPQITSPFLDSQLLFNLSPQQTGSIFWGIQGGKNNDVTPDRMARRPGLPLSRTRRRNSPISPRQLSDIYVRPLNRLVRANAVHDSGGDTH